MYLNLIIINRWQIFRDLHLLIRLARVRRIFVMQLDKCLTELWEKRIRLIYIDNLHRLYYFVAQIDKKNRLILAAIDCKCGRHKVGIKQWTFKNHATTKIKCLRILPITNFIKTAATSLIILLILFHSIFNFCHKFKIKLPKR